MKRGVVAIMAAWLCVLSGAAGAAAGEPLAPACVMDRVPVCALGDEGEPSVLVALIVFAGAADEAPGAAGTAHYLEHLLFRDRDGAPAAGADIDAFGNAYTRHAVTTFHWTVPRARLGDAIDRALSVLDRPEPSAEAAEQERRIVRREDERDSASLSQRVAIAHWQALMAGTPYARPVIGGPDGIAQLDVAAALAFHDAHYRPDNAVLVLSGTWPGAGAPLDGLGPFPPPAADRVRAGTQESLVADPAARVVERSAARLVKAPTDPAGRAALAVLGAFLGSRMEGAPHRPLVREREAVKALDLEVFTPAPGLAALGVELVLRPDVTADALGPIAEAFDAYLADTAARGLDDATVARLTARLERDVRRERGAPVDTAWSLVGWLEDGYTLAQWQAFPDLLGAVTPDAVNALLAHFAQPPWRAVTSDRVPEP